MASILELAGVALAALLSENFVLVSCMGIGTRTEAFRDPMDAVRTGYCLTAVMVLGALCAWLIDFFLLGRFGWQHYRLLVLALLIPGLVAGLRKFLKVCIPELSRRIDGQLKSVATNCAALGSALLISQRSYSLPARADIRSVRRNRRYCGTGQLCRPAKRGGLGELSQILPGNTHSTHYGRADGHGPCGLLWSAPGLRA